MAQIFGVNRVALARSLAASLPPRFLLPNPAWRAFLRSPHQTSLGRRNASSKDGGPRILEKPARFNPPSHGARLPRNKAPPRHYGGSLSQEESKAQARREYPGMLPPQGTVAHGFIHSRAFHLTITLGTLTILAITTFVLNFTHNSPFAHLLPKASEFWSHPIDFIGTWIQVLRLHERDRNEKVIAQHTRHTDDVVKRAYYRKVHGLDKENPIANFFKTEEEKAEEERERAEEAEEDAKMGAEVVATGTGAGEVAGEGKKRSKWLGIF